MASLRRRWNVKYDSFIKPGSVLARTVSIEIEMPADLARFRMPAGLNARLQELLDRQDGGQRLTRAERKEAEGLVDMAEMLTLLRLRAARTKSRNA